MITGYIWRPWFMGTREYLTGTGWTPITLLAQEFTEDEYKTVYQPHGYNFEPKKQQPKPKEENFDRLWEFPN